MKRKTSVFLALTLIMTMLMPMTGHVYASADAITLEGEDFTKSSDSSAADWNKAEGSNLSGGYFGKMETLTGGLIIEKSFEINKTGYYDIGFTMAANAGGTQDSSNDRYQWYSPVSFKIDSADFAKITSVTSGANLSEVSKISSVWYNYALAVPVYLEKGTHTAYFSVDTTRKNDSYYVFSLDKIDISPAAAFDSVDSVSGGIVQFERFASSSSVKTGLDKDKNSDTGIKGIGFNGNSSKSYSVDLYFDVKASGYYNVDVFAAVNGGSTTWLSPLTMDVNSKTVNISALSPVAADPVYYIQTIDYPINKFSPSESYYFEKGINKITFTAGARAVGECGLAFALDYIKLTPDFILPQIKVFGESTVEFEDFETNYIHSGITEGYTDKKAVVREGATGTYSLDIKFDVAVSGYYDMEVYAAIYGQANSALGLGQVTWLSPMSMTHNTETYDVSGSFVSSGLAGYEIKNDTYPIRKYASPKEIFFEKGVNTITVNMTERPGDGGSMWFAIDCLKFNRAAAASPDYRIEPETSAEDGIEYAAAASGGLYVLADGTEEKTYELTYNAPAAGDYELTLALAANVGSGIGEALRQVELSVNGNGKTTLTKDSTCYLVGDTYFMGDDSELIFGKYLLKNSVSLNAGSNTIIITIPAAQASAKAALDYVDVIAVPDIGNPELNIEATMAAGDVQNISLGIEPADVYMITYGSANEAVATVDGTGMITANKTGRTTITVSIYAAQTSEAYVLTGDIEVYDNIRISNISKTDGAVTFTVNSKDGIAVDTAKVIIAYYTDASMSQLADYAVYDIPSLNAGADTGAVTKTLENYTTGGKTAIYVLENSSLKPLTVKKIIN